jgi:hypothetical protein
VYYQWNPRALKVSNRGNHTIWVSVRLGVFLFLTSSKCLQCLLWGVYLLYCIIPCFAILRCRYSTVLVLGVEFAWINGVLSRAVVEVAQFNPIININIDNSIQDSSIKFVYTCLQILPTKKTNPHSLLI